MSLTSVNINHFPLFWRHVRSRKHPGFDARLTQVWLLALIFKAGPQGRGFCFRVCEMKTVIIPPSQICCVRVYTCARRVPVPYAGASQVVPVVKTLPANAGDVREAGLIPGSGRSPGGGHGNPLQDSCLENPLDKGLPREAWWAAVHGAAKSQTRLSN